MPSASHSALLCCLLRISVQQLLLVAGVGVVGAAHASCLHAGWRLRAFAACSPGCPLSGVPFSLLSSPQFTRSPLFPALPPYLALSFPDPLWQLCACLSGRFYQLLCRGGLCCCISGVAVLGGFVSFALLPCAVSRCPLVTAVCLPVWPLSPAPVPGWACCCILGAAAFGGFCFLLLPPGGWLCCVSWPASCRATQLFVLGWHSPGARHFPCLSVRPIGQPVRCCAACTPPSLTQLRCICSVTLSW